jgi:uncharacterized membrane protein
MRKWIPAALIITAVAASLIAYPRLPETMPTHWNMSGQVDGWSSRIWGAWGLPLAMAVIWFTMRFLPHIDPRRANYEKFRGAYEALIVAILAFMLALHLVLLMSAMGTVVPMDRVIVAGVGALFIVIGAILPRARSNWFVGIRTPWTLSSEVSWERTHKLGGVLFMAFGAIALIVAAVAPGAVKLVLLGCGIPMALFLIIYSYVVWKEDQGGGATRV